MSINNFTALVVRQDSSGASTAQIESVDFNSLPPGDVVVEVLFSSLNYKDSLAITGKGPVVRQFPMVPGIDLAGRVRTSSHPDFHASDEVLVTGCGLGEVHWGGLSQLARLSGAWLIYRPSIFTLRQCMAIGTAGFTAMQCVLALKRHGITPNQGDILVTGATGGVGSLAITILHGMGYSVTASTGRPMEADYLYSLGAKSILDRNTLSTPGKPLNKEKWAGAIDTVGGHTLANVCASLKANGAVAACGLVGGGDLPTTVMPFILRGITLYGINSVSVSSEERHVVWQQLQQHLNVARLEAMTKDISLNEVLAIAPSFLQGQVRGRVVVEIPA